VDYLCRFGDLAEIPKVYTSGIFKWHESPV
jgi:hypothetical protein